MENDHYIIYLYNFTINWYALELFDLTSVDLWNSAN